MIAVVIEDRGAIRETDVEADDALRFVARLLGAGSRPTIVGAFAHNRVLLLADKAAMAAADARNLVPAAALPRAMSHTYGTVVAVALAAPFEPSAAPYAVQDMRLAMYCDLLSGRLRTLDPKPKKVNREDKEDKDKDKPKVSRRASASTSTSTGAHTADKADKAKTETKTKRRDVDVYAPVEAAKHPRDLSTHKTTKVPAVPTVAKLKSEVKHKHKHETDDDDDEPRRTVKTRTRPPTRAAATAASKVIRDAASDPAKLRAALGGGDDDYVSAEDSDFSLPDTSDTVPTSSESDSDESD